MEYLVLSLAIIGLLSLLSSSWRLTAQRDVLSEGLMGWVMLWGGRYGRFCV